MSDVILEGRGISKSFHSGFGLRRRPVLSGLDIRLHREETLVLMGPSGCGKSTLARILMRLIDPDEGRVLFHGRDITRAHGRALLPFRRKVQLISQRPETFFDPRRKLGDSVLEPLSIFGLRERRDMLPALLGEVKLTDELLGRYPHQVSGGEIQRLSLCRALLLEPEILVLDEPTSMLDVSVQAQVLQILRRLRAEHGLACLFITHDHEVASFMGDRLYDFSPPGQ